MRGVAAMDIGIGSEMRARAAPGRERRSAIALYCPAREQRARLEPRFATAGPTYVKRS